MKLKKTITSIFIVPTLKIDRDALNDNQFINGYLKDVRRDVQYENAVYLLFKPKNLDSFRLFLDAEYERTKDVIDDYDYEDGYVVVVYKLNKKWNTDFDLVKTGAYSKTSDDFQKQFPKVIKIMKNNLHRDEVSLQFRIFRKSQDLKNLWEDKLDMEFTDDMEVWPGFSVEKEELDLDKIKDLELV
jgi:hypothetical protein